MSLRNHTALADLVLIRIYYGDRRVALIYDCPRWIATCHCFAKLAGLLFRQLNHGMYSNNSVCLQWVSSRQCTSNALTDCFRLKPAGEYMCQR